jgi:nucleoid-associated protein YgaU
VRRVARLALGLTLATGAVAAPAGAETTHPAPVAVLLDWPVAPPRTVAPALDWPVAAPPAPPPPLAAAPEEVVVRPGDTLWGLAAAQLPPGATDAAIARAWPVWWGTNRAVIGTDPDLLHPGTRLVPPPSTPR